MKKIHFIVIIFALILIITSFSTSAASESASIKVASSDHKIYLNGERLYPCDANNNPVFPIMFGGTTYLPVRALAESIGLEVIWDSDTNSILLYDGLVNEDLFLYNPASSALTGSVIQIYYSDVSIFLNGEKLNFNTIPFKYNGTTYLPLRAVAESLNMYVQWFEDSQSIYLFDSEFTRTVSPDGIPILASLGDYYPTRITRYDDKTIYIYDTYVLGSSFSLLDYHDFLINLGYSTNPLSEDSEGNPVFSYFNTNSTVMFLLKDNIIALSAINYPINNNVSTQPDNYIKDNINVKYSDDTPDVLKVNMTFPLWLKSDKSLNHSLGKLVFDEYDREGVWSKYGKYGSDYGAYSIWNESGLYGSKTSTYSAFNKFALHPPMIVDNYGKLIGYLTVNENIDHGVTLNQLIDFLLINDQ